MVKIGIIGSRKRNSEGDYNAVKFEFLNLFASFVNKYNVEIVSGGCPTGADKFAEIIAKEHGIYMTTHYPDWNRFGKQAGAIRNKKIAEESDYLIACISEDRTGGTEITIHEFSRLKKGKNRLILV